MIYILIFLAGITIGILYEQQYNKTMNAETLKRIAKEQYDLGVMVGKLGPGAVDKTPFKVET